MRSTRSPGSAVGARASAAMKNIVPVRQRVKRLAGTTAGRPGTSRQCDLHPPGRVRRWAHRSAGTDDRRGDRRTRGGRSPPTAARIDERAHSSAARSSSARASPTGSHGESCAAHSVSDIHMLPMPARTRWSCKTSPSGFVGSTRRSRCTRAAGSVPSASRSGPSRASGRARASGPGRSTASLRASRRGGRATAARRAPPRPARCASGRSCAGGCEPSPRPRSAAAGACRPPPRPPGGGRRRPPRPPSRAPAGAARTPRPAEPTSGWSRAAARWRESPSGTGRIVLGGTWSRLRPGKF